MNRNFRKALILATPKTGLRYHLAKSSLREFENGTSFQPVIVDKRG